MAEQLTQLSATEQLALLRAKKISSRELFDEFWSQHEAQNAALNAVVHTQPERALADCVRADDALARGEWLGPLHGLTMTIKDAIAVEGMVSTGGAEELKAYVPSADAPAVARLRAAGASVYGKTNVPRWSGEIQTYNDVYGTSNNPWDLTRTTGGSSGGAAAAVAAGLTAFELGTDIGGSVRIPAAFCGTFSHKPSHGVISQRGYLSHVGAGATDADINVFGPLARSVEDLQLALDVLAGPDEEKAHAWQLNLPSSRHERLADFRIGTWLDDPACEVDTEIVGMLDDVVALIGKEGASIDSAKPPIDLDESCQLFMSLVYGAMSKSFDYEVGKQLGGWHVDWVTNDEKRAVLRQRWRSYFRDHDVLLCPVMPMTAFPHDHSKPMLNRTVVVNGKERPHLSCMHWLGSFGVAYLPATVIPIGRTTAGLPVGMQIVGPYLEDRTTLAVAAEISSRLEGFVAPPVLQAPPEARS